MLDISLIPIIFAVINATVPVGNGQVDVPLSIEPVSSVGITPAAPAQQPAANIAGIQVDQATLTAIITPVVAAVGGLIYKNKKDSEKEDTRSNLMAESQLKQVHSLQETDKADYIFKTQLVTYLDNPNEENKLKLKELANKSRQEYAAYYENIQPEPLDYSKDEVVRKISAVQKRSTPTI